MRSHQNRFTEKNKLHYFQSLLREEAIDFWQTRCIITETTLKDVLEKYRKLIAKDELEEVSKIKWNQLIYNPTKKNFLDFIKTPKKTATQAFYHRDARFVEIFLFGKVPVQIHATFPQQLNQKRVYRRSKLSTRGVFDINNSSRNQRVTINSMRYPVTVKGNRVK